jgi:hypothetical protein
MGVENNECVIATTWDEDAVTKIRAWISNLPSDQKQLFAVVPSIVNGKQTIFLAPDGSKKGWDEAERGEALRDQFIEQLKRFDYNDGSNPFSFVEIGYGEFGQKVLRGNCKNQYGDTEYAGV